MTRETLLNRRQTETFKFTNNNIKHFVSYSCFDDGRVAEVFIDAGKVGSDAQTYARDAAVILSLALQFGTDLKTIQYALTRKDDGSPAGPIGVVIDMLVKITEIPPQDHAAQPRSE